MQHDTIVTAPGSLGDVNPMIAIGRRLQSKGRRVLFLAAEPYLHLAERAGLQVSILTKRDDFHRMIHDPDLWHAFRGPRLLFDQALGASLNTHFRFLEQNCVPGKTLLVSHFLDFAGRIYRDLHPTTRMVSVVLAPATLRSLRNPPRVSASGFECRLPKSMLRFAYWCADRWIDSYALKHIDPLRRRLGLPSIRRVMNEWWLSPDLGIAMFPKWFSICKEDMPKQMHNIGFPLADSGDIVAPEVEVQLANVMAHFGDRRPIVFAPGSAHHQARAFLAAANEACDRLKLPGLLLSPNPNELPQQLAPGVASAQYIPFGKLLHRSSTVVHHGGIGTTSQCFATGVPQLVLPMAFDQFDNADRVKRLGCGSWMPMKQINAEKLVSQLQDLPQQSRHVAEVAANFDVQADESDIAADLIYSHCVLN